MFAVLTVALGCLRRSTVVTRTHTSRGPMYSLVEYGCQRQEEALRIAHANHDACHSAAWKQIREIARGVSSDGRAMCLKIHRDFVCNSTPAFETDDGKTRRLSVVNAHTAVGNFYWLVMLNTHFVMG